MGELNYRVECTVLNVTSNRSCSSMGIGVFDRSCCGCLGCEMNVSSSRFYLRCMLHMVPRNYYTEMLDTEQRM